MKRRKLLGMLLAAVCLVTAVPGMAYAENLTLTGEKEAVQETGQKDPGDASLKVSGKEGAKETDTEKNAPKQETADKKAEGKKETDQETGEGTKKEQAQTGQMEKGREKNTAAGDTNGGKNQEGKFGSPDPTGEYDFTGVVPNDEPPADFDRYDYNPQADEPMLLGIDTWENLKADIAKRSEWVDKDNGDGRVTLYYSSNSGVYKGTEDMNVVLVQDKSGSMDPNYGFNLALTKYGYSVNGVNHWWYPCRSVEGWSENAAECVGEEYRNALNGNVFVPGENYYNSPCQDADNRYYYLMVKEDANSPSLQAGQMVHGNNLYNISSTDLHSYYRLDSREEAVSYLAAGRRVVRCDNWIKSDGILDKRQFYFLDVSQVYDFGDRQLFRTCDDTGESTAASRLAKSQWFMDKVVDGIRDLNPSNKIAYVPFWGAVPENGSWSNASSGGSTDNIYTDNENKLTYKNGVSYLGFTDSPNFGSLKSQINHPFTYEGTNWSRALQKSIDLLNGRNSAEKQKKTLVVFLTDGMPQGTQGKPSDLNNPYINGVNEAAALKGINGVTVYACGVGINQQDNTIRPRLSNLDSSSYALTVQYVSEFNDLYNDVMDRINSEFSITIRGNDAFYTDQLAGPFTLDESKLGSGWKVLASPGSGTTKGVPAAVYNAAKAGAKYIYVRSTKTVYWYIGTMTDGGYSAAGHSMNFPVKYSGYNTPTGGTDKQEKTNTQQKLTYVPSTNPNTVDTVTLDAPTLVFNRADNPSITIKKNIDGAAFTTDQTYRFAFSKNKQSGKVVNKAGSAAVTVKAGSKSAAASVPINPGTYYVYEVDDKDNIISSQVQTAKVSMAPEITTVTGNPVSVTSTAGRYDNANNKLQIKAVSANVEFTNHYVSVAVQKNWDDSNSSRRPDEITVNLLKNGTKVGSKSITADMGWKYTFKNLEKYDVTGKEIKYTVTEEKVPGYEGKTEYSTSGAVITAKVTNTLMIADLTVTKTIPSDADTIWWDHGNPTFMVKVSGTGLDGKGYTFYHTFVFDREYVKKNARDGKVSMSYTFKDIPNSTDYQCEELTVSRWRLESVKGNGTNVKVTTGDTKSQAEVFGTYADANLKARPEGTEVTFTNVKDDYQWFNHITSVHNVIKK